MLAAFYTHRSDRRLQPAPAEVWQALVKEGYLGRLMLALLRMCAARALRTAGCALHFVSSIVIGKVLLLVGKLCNRIHLLGLTQIRVAHRKPCSASGCAHIDSFKRVLLPSSPD
jgi:hypothetical protein